MPITNIPNNENKTNRANGSFPQPRSASPCNPPNGPSDRRNNDFMSLAGGASPVNPPNDGLKFKIADAPMTQPQSAVSKGAGVVAVNAGNSGRAQAPAEITRGE